MVHQDKADSEARGNQSLAGRFGYFLVFSARGGGRESPRRWEGRGGRFLIEIPGGGGGSQGGGGAEGQGGCLRRIGELGGGLNIFSAWSKSAKIQLSLFSKPSRALKPVWEIVEGDCS